MQIVGVVKDAKYDRGEARRFRRCSSCPYRQDSTVGSLHFYVRTVGDPTQLLRAIPERS